ncbi:MAG: membrane dipeptidase [bacterium]|nr:membrane dipeptidase [bacterium]
MKRYWIIGILILTSAVIFSGTLWSGDPYMEKAKKLAKEFIITDGHVDVPYRLEEKWEDVGLKTEGGHFDYPRAKAGGMDAPFMSIYVPARFETDGGAKKLADKLIDMVNGIIKKHPDKFASAGTVADVKANFKKGLISLPMGMENGAPIEGKLENVKYFHDRGIRYITLTHSKDNHICGSSYDENHKWKGLSPFGKKVVAEMNRVGIMIDVSHISDDSFYQVMELTKVPVIASHSSCRHFTPGFERNMSDDMLRKLAKNGGVIQINYGTYFLTKEFQDASRKMENARKEYEAKHKIKLKRDEPEYKTFRDKYLAQHPMPQSRVEDVANHIDHVVKLVGIDYVGLGSDFDGVGSLPVGLEDVSQLPNLIAALLKKGYSSEDIEKVCSGNVFRVWKAAEAYARQSGGTR